VGQNPPPRVVLGRIVGAHGLRGGLRVRFFGDDAGNLARAPEVELAATPDGAGAVRHEVAGIRPGRSGEVTLRLADVRVREAAEALRGRLVLVDPRHLARLPEGEHYWFELVGCEVVGRGGERVGRVTEIWETGGAHDVLVVAGEDGRRVLLPAVDAFLTEIDVAARRIVVDLIPGLLADAIPGDA
jgi:16S rRNA processing protein RimM